jgi:hypothetical protein
MYRERGESRARAQHDILMRSLEKVAGEAEGEIRGWKIKLIIFVGGTCGSVHTQTFNDNLKELGVVESKRNIIQKGLVHELLDAQDTVLSSYFVQRSGERDASRSTDWLLLLLLLLAAAAPPPPLRVYFAHRMGSV